jgi:hypothetical protein
MGSIVGLGVVGLWVAWCTLYTQSKCHHCTACDAVRCALCCTLYHSLYCLLS